MANEKQWYTAMNLALANTSTDLARCQSVLFAYTQILLNLDRGTTYGPLGAPPVPATVATCIGSSDSVTAGMDGVNRLTSYDKWVRANVSGNPHSWIVLKLGNYYITIAWSYFNSSAAIHYCTTAISKALPTGGSTTARPTATDEGTITNQLFTTNTTSLWSGGRAHLTITNEAQPMFWILVSQNGTGLFNSGLGLQEKKDAHASDTFKGVLFCEGASASLLRDDGESFMSTTTSAFAGRSLNNTTAVKYCFLKRCLSSAQSWQATIAGTGSDQQTGEFHRLYAELVCSTSGKYGFSGGGTFYDINEIHRAQHGTTYPASGDVERIAVGCLLLPFTAVPTI